MEDVKKPRGRPKKRTFDDLDLGKKEGEKGEKKEKRSKKENLDEMRQVLQTEHDRKLFDCWVRNDDRGLAEALYETFPNDVIIHQTTSKMWIWNKTHALWTESNMNNNMMLFELFGKFIDVELPKVASKAEFLS